MRHPNVRLLAGLAVGLLLGWLLFGGSPPPTEIAVPGDASGHAHAEVWTCSMHPQVHRDAPGACPICGMDLVPRGGDAEPSLTSSEVRLSEEARRIARIETTTIRESTPVKEIVFPGKVRADERRIVHLTARFGGRIEKLFVNFTGQHVRQGQKLLSIYSPELVTAQKELFEAKRLADGRPAFYRAARTKLKLWDLTDAQIDAIETEGEPRYVFDVVSPIDGTVTRRHVADGHYADQGDALLEVTDLSRVWVLFDAYESDLPWVSVGDRIEFTIRSLPTRTFESRVTFIDPVVDPLRRVASVRTELDNSEGLLKPEMFASGVLRTELPRAENALTVPRSAVLWTGKRAIVYVAVPGREGVFEHREIVLGEDAGPEFVVVSGLAAGEEVVTNGAFKVDAAAQLEARRSMMTPALDGERSADGRPPAAERPAAPRTSARPAPRTADPSPAVEGPDAAEFRARLLAFLEDSFAVRDALVADDPSAAARAAATTAGSLERVDDLLLGDADHQIAWAAARDELRSALDTLRYASDLPTQRDAFATVSEEAIAALQVLGITASDRGHLWIHHCPMARDNRGAHWLSEDREVLNPYMGAAMPACGNPPEPL